MKRLIQIFPVIFLAGCTFGPKYQRPAINAPATYRGAATETQAAAESFGDMKWDAVFTDEELRKLIRKALEQNFDVRVAAARVLQAQAQVSITRADQFPTINGTGSAGRSRSPSNPIFPGFEANQTQLGLSAAWQLDFWGRYRKATEAARATLLANEWARRAVVTSLVANVASAYFQLRELDLELEISKRTLAARQEALKLNQTLEKGGSISLLDVRQAEILVETASRTIPDLERQIEQQENLLSTLLGENPGPAPRGLKLIEQPLIASIPSGLPSALLERRPDIRQAEQQLIAANAQIGVAKAAYFPQISLTGTAGFQAYSMTGLFDSKVFNVGTSMTQPIFDMGKIRANVRLTEAQKQEMLLTYQKSIQQAFREVSDSLVAYQKNREYRERQQSLREAAQGAARLSDIRYKGGASSYLEVLTSETNLFDAELDLAKAQLNERTAIIQVYNALGGGWQP